MGVRDLRFFTGSATSRCSNGCGRGRAELFEAGAGRVAGGRGSAGWRAIGGGRRRRKPDGQADRSALGAAGRRDRGGAQRGNWRGGTGNHGKEWELSLQRAGGG